MSLGMLMMLLRTLLTTMRVSALWLVGTWPRLMKCDLMLTMRWLRANRLLPKRLGAFDLPRCHPLRKWHPIGSLICRTDHGASGACLRSVAMHHIIDYLNIPENFRSSVLTIATCVIGGMMT